MTLRKTVKYAARSTRREETGERLASIETRLEDVSVDIKNFQSITNDVIKENAKHGQELAGLSSRLKIVLGILGAIGVAVIGVIARMIIKV
jgi:Flp pilus assembly protein TadB